MSDEAIRVAVPRGWALKPVNHTLVCVVRQWMHVGCMDYKQSEKSIAKSASQKSSDITIVITTPPPTGERSIVMSVSVCVSVRNHISGTTRPIFAKFWYMLPMAVARSSSGGVVIRYVLPVLRITSCLLISQGCSASPPS